MLNQKSTDLKTPYRFRQSENCSRKPIRHSVGDQYVGELNAALGIPASLTAPRVKNPDLERLTAMAPDDPSVGGNPVEMNVGNTRALFEACF